MKDLNLQADNSLPTIHLQIFRLAPTNPHPFLFILAHSHLLLSNVIHGTMPPYRCRRHRRHHNKMYPRASATGPNKMQEIVPKSGSSYRYVSSLLCSYLTG